MQIDKVENGYIITDGRYRYIYDKLEKVFEYIAKEMPYYSSNQSKECLVQITYIEKGSK
jgi:hypothetical protein